MKYSIISLKDFISIRDKSLNAEYKAFVTLYTVEQYQSLNAKAFVSETKKSGFVITGECDLISVFSEKDSHEGNQAIESAIENGAKTLDCLGDKLLSIYQKHGFRIEKIIQWDNDYAPDNWNYAKHGKPNVYFMRLSYETI